MRRVLIVAAVAGFWLFSWVDPAGATLSPECTASATLEGDDGTTAKVDGATSTRVRIPRSADVTYNGTITVPEPSDEMPYSGSVNLDVAPGLDLIPGLDDPNVASWEWSGVTDKTAVENGKTDYDLDLPADLGGGIKATAKGSHTQAGITCTGSVDVKIGGSVVNPASVGSGLLAGAGAAGLVVAARGTAA